MENYSEEYIENWGRYLRESKRCFEDSWNTRTRPVHNKNDIDIIRCIGSGGFGKVQLGKMNNSFYAIKILQNFDIDSDNFERVMDEKKALEATKFPFIIHMCFYFFDVQYTYFVMPFIPGGDLWYHLRKNYRFTEPDVRFYTSQIVLAIEYLHYMSLIHRDLKPENILIDADGYVKLGDLGFCKRIVARTYTMCGTMQYIAPEVVLNLGYGLAADWWSFGVLLYEMRTGVTPFYCKNEFAMCQKIVDCYYVFQPYFSKDLRNLIQGLLQPNPVSRLGNLKDGAKDIKDHLWFKEVNWLDVLNKRVVPPFVPQLTGPGDVTYIVDAETFTPAPRPSSWREYQQDFLEI